jgi:hypothetical protein
LHSSTSFPGTRAETASGSSAPALSLAAASSEAASSSAAHAPAHSSQSSASRHLEIRSAETPFQIRFQNRLDLSDNSVQDLHPFAPQRFRKGQADSSADQAIQSGIHDEAGPL